MNKTVEETLELGIREQRRIAVCDWKVTLLLKIEADERDDIPAEEIIERVKRMLKHE